MFSPDNLLYILKKPQLCNLPKKKKIIQGLPVAIKSTKWDFVHFQGAFSMLSFKFLLSIDI